MLVLMFGNATVSTTYLSGLSNAIQAVTDPTRFGENFLEQYATSVVPKIIGQTVGMADPYKREVTACSTPSRASCRGCARSCCRSATCGASRSRTSAGSP
jgi:hypothetical protein